MAYLPIFATLGVTLVAATFATPLIAKLDQTPGSKEQPVTEPVESMQAAG
jgi:hypothetical protein